MRITAFMLLLVMAGPARVPAQTSGPVEVGTAWDIYARIEVQQSRYAVGDTACVRVSLSNTADRRVGIVAMGTSDMMHLVVKRNGQLVRPTGSPAGSATAAPGSFPARAVWPLANGQWVPLTYWGYQIHDAGAYTVEGVPQVHGPRSPADTTVRSNEVSFTLSQDSKTHASCRVIEPSEAQRPNSAAMTAYADSLFEAQRARIGAQP